MAKRSSFRAKARIIQILGEESIRDNTVGLIELIKNGYDADADEVKVSLENLKNPEKTVITVEDDGVGMSEETIRGPWLDIATGVKDKQKQSKKRTKKERLPLGEKGVGRFAAQRLGRILEMITKPEGSDTEFYTKINWDDWDKEDVFVDDINIDIESRKPEYFTGKNGGTLLKMSRSKYAWSIKDLERLQTALIRMLLPTRENKDFRVVLSIPEYRQYENLKLEQILEKYMFKLDFSINEEGRCKYTFYKRNADNTVEKSTNEELLWSKINPKEWEETTPSCGPFKGTLFAWLKDPQALQQYGLNADRLNALAGVSVYRDNFRVLPYGDEDDDWLGLDKRRVLSPGRRFDRSQMIGLIEIDQLGNPQLKDKTNREGLLNNTAYRDFRNFVLGAVDLLESQSQAERTKISDEKKSAAKKKQEEAEATTKKRLKELEKKLEKVEKTFEKPKEEQFKLGEDQVVIQKQELSKLKEEAQLANKAFEDSRRAWKILYDNLKDAGEEQSAIFYHLLGMGLASERFTHEVDISVSALNHYMKKLDENVRESGNPDIRDSLQNLVFILNKMMNETKLMDVFRFVTSESSEDIISVYDTIKLVLEGHNEEIKEKGIEVVKYRNSDFKVKMRKSALAQVIDNVICNAIYWLSQRTNKDKKRELYIDVQGDAKRLVIGNNGQALDPSLKTSLFWIPFQSRKFEGRGLGMYISAQILKEYGATIGIVDEKRTKEKYGNVAFEIVFK
ncbi:MAG: ATP-binding protein [Candidatus Micrarchaeales archaeon]|uniref:histidine kinase n=1 Tax=Candidatus Micrarchaeum acidiphilum ARMAN-2 TaxID=425595 RepID=C7DGG0_MICA2|nr:MAG: Signal transduction histidine kinase regulating C4-dicarboxylate transport system [Candidatus Micrarchaeum acidiphilum ARMAN-2]MCW6161097.1 ATP-binding protein [Candidatus Micrarchaeales archaeon]